MKQAKLAVITVVLAFLGACSPGIHGKVLLFDPNMQPIPPAVETSEGTVVNMINTTSTIEQASHAVTVNAKGEYESEKDKIIPGKYKVEASRIGFETNTQDVEVGRFGGTGVDFKLKKIKEGKRRSIEGSKSDEDKIINPGEVNIQPPTM